MSELIIPQRITHALGRVPVNSGSGSSDSPFLISPQPMSLTRRFVCQSKSVGAAGSPVRPLLRVVRSSLAPQFICVQSASPTFSTHLSIQYFRVKSLSRSNMAGPAYLKIWTTVLHNSKLLPMTLSERGFYLWLLVMCKEQRDDGQVWVRSWSDLGSKCACQGRTACKIVAKLQQVRLLSYTVNDQGTIAIEIPNYKEWQNLEVSEVLQKTRQNAHGVQSSSQNAQQQSRAEQSRAEQSNTKSGKPDDSIPYSEIISDLNGVLGTKYRDKTEETRQGIRRWWKQGFKLEDFKAVHRIKKQEWEGTDQAVYLRPSTLYGPKFENYLNQGSAKKTDKKLIGEKDYGPAGERPF